VTAAMVLPVGFKVNSGSIANVQQLVFQQVYIGLMKGYRYIGQCWASYFIK